MEIFLKACTIALLVTFLVVLAIALVYIGILIGDEITDYRGMTYEERRKISLENDALFTRWVADKRIYDKTALPLW